MGKALIIGCGGVASVTIHKCCQNSDVFEEICIASRTKSKCDGGGNRHQTKIKLTDDHELRTYFDKELKSVIPGVCSIDYGTEAWVVCPRRLLGFKHDSMDLPEVNFSLHRHRPYVPEHGLYQQLRCIGQHCAVLYVDFLYYAG